MRYFIVLQLLSALSLGTVPVSAREASADTCDLRVIEGKTEHGRIWEDLSEALGVRWPRLASAIRKGELTEPVLLDWVRAAHGPGSTQEDRDLVLLTADQWLRSSSTSGGTHARNHKLAAGWEDFGFTLSPGEGDVWLYCGSVLPSLAARVGTNRWAERAFLLLLDQGWVTNCDIDFEGAEFGNDRFSPVLIHGERYLERHHPRTALWASVALRVAAAHETVWSLSQVSFQRDFRDSLEGKGPAHRERAIELYRTIARGMKESPLRDAITRRAALLERGGDSKCFVYYDDNC